ncbi:hypothetical protein [Novosphingobium sp. M1R2S20]|uniref:Uncharacterized protein n=1 Tax=Novosphingobium rhizovicinum TaxID=3228928 RepID=A0ABV3RBV8_9SPHN
MNGTDARQTLARPSTMRYEGAMSTITRTRSAKAIKIYCPVDRATLKLIQEGRLDDIDQWSALAAIVDVVRADNPLGDFGIYKSVMEVSLGWELFTPSVEARPTLGEAGATTASPTVVLTIYVPSDASSDAISGAMTAILAAHPWETPVIELSDTSLVMRS